MTDDRADTEQANTERSAIRARFVAARARVDAVVPSDWFQQRDDEANTVKQVAAVRRRTAA